MTEATLVNWSDFARHGKKYAEMVEQGQTFVILKDSQPFAIVRKVEPGEVRVSVEVRHEVR